jgi:hypothetical protein
MSNQEHHMSNHEHRMSNHRHILAGGNINRQSQVAVNVQGSSACGS